MKKKIVAMCLVVALAVVAIGGATLAYFTDKDQVENTFTVGNVDIDLYEYTDLDNDGKLEEQKFQEFLKYSDIMPGDHMAKVPTIENTGKNDAYVRVAVVMNHVSPINEAIDDVYEEKDYTDEQIQAVYDEVFEGWGLSYTRRPSDDPDVATRRLWMKERTNDSKVLFGGQVDMYCNLGGYGMFDVNNTFKTEADTDEEGIDYACAGYYRNAAKEEERVYVFYLKLAPGEKYELFQGLNAPADFDADQLAMFEGLKIGIYADAIQTANFVDTTDEATGEVTSAAVNAFTALEAANPLGWWNASSEAGE